MANLAMEEAHSDGDVFYAGAVTDTDKLNGYSRAINNNTDYHTLYNQSEGGAIKHIAGNRTLISVVACSATVFVMVDGTNTYRGVLSAGKITWTAKEDQITSPIGVIACDADPTKIVVWASNGECSASIDSGANFLDAVADPANCTNIKNASYPTTGLVVFCGTSSSGNKIWRATDPTDGTPLTFAQVSTGATSTMYLIHMKDVNDGIATDGTNVWTTGIESADDAADTWTDMGDDWTNMVSDGYQGLFMTSTTTAILADAARGLRYWIDGSDAYESTFLLAANYVASNVVKATNGNYYCIYFPSSSITDANPVMLFKSTDSGLTWKIKVIGVMDNSKAATSFLAPTLSEYDTNKLLFGADSILITIDESYTGAE